MKFATRCQNMNHGRMNAPVKFCPTCGEIVNRAAVGKCSESTHSSLRKSRHAFCHDCGKQLG